MFSGWDPNQIFGYYHRFWGFVSDVSEDVADLHERLGEVSLALTSQKHRAQWVSHPEQKRHQDQRN
jgi:hypothetical protein